MKEILVKDIIRITNGKLICGDENTKCENFSKDTREIVQGDIYLGIKGERVNGSAFYKDAFHKGAKGCILQEVEINQQDIQNYQDRFILVVEDVVKALQQIAKLKREQYHIPVVGITGSVGKTSTKDMIASVLSQKYKVLKTQGNYNNEIGLPLTILKLKEEDIMVLEMGMSAFGEISLLTDIAQPSTAVITIIGSSHIGELGSRENILKAKLEILEKLDSNGKVIINNDNDLLHKWHDSNVDFHEHITYGIENCSNLMATNIKINDQGSEYDINIEKQLYHVTIPVGGNHFVYNSLAAIAVGLTYNIPMKSIIQGIKELSLTKKRMEIVRNAKNAMIINDSYNASYESVKAALEYMNSMQSNKKIAVLGDVLELGKFSQKLHEQIGEEVWKNGVDILITVGTEAKYIAQKAIDLGFETTKVYILDKNEEAIQVLNKIIEKNDIVLVKASNGMHFDEIVEKIV